MILKSFRISLYFSSWAFTDKSSWYGAYTSQLMRWMYFRPEIRKRNRTFFIVERQWCHVFEWNLHVVAYKKKLSSHSIVQRRFLSRENSFQDFDWQDRQLSLLRFWRGSVQMKLFIIWSNFRNVSTKKRITNLKDSNIIYYDLFQNQNDRIYSHFIYSLDINYSSTIFVVFQNEYTIWYYIYVYMRSVFFSRVHFEYQTIKLIFLIFSKIFMMTDNDFWYIDFLLTNSKKNMMFSLHIDLHNNQNNRF